MDNSEQWYDRNSRFICAQGIPLSILDLCQQFDLDCNRILRGTSLFLDDILNQGPRISAEQLLQIVDNTLRSIGAEDTHFLIGHRWFPSHCGAASTYLEGATNLYHALELLIRYQPILSPLIRPVFFTDEQFGYIFWLDDCGVGKLEQPLVEAMTVALITYSKRQQGQHLPWQINFRFNHPKHMEQYWFHMGDDIRFSEAYTFLRIPKQYLFHTWRKDTLCLQRIYNEAEQQRQALPAPQSFLTTVDQNIHQGLLCGDKQLLQLEGIARAMKLSTSTLKRHFKKANTHFQRRLDQERLLRALYLMNIKQQGLDSVANQLGFHDGAGFRRSFKRWTGVTPSQLSLR